MKILGFILSIIFMFSTISLAYSTAENTTTELTEQIIQKKINGNPALEKIKTPITYGKTSLRENEYLNKLQSYSPPDQTKTQNYEINCRYNSYNITYSISNGIVKNINQQSGFDGVDISITASDNGIISIMLPKELLLKDLNELRFQIKNSFKSKQFMLTPPITVSNNILLLVPFEKGDVKLYVSPYGQRFNCDQPSKISESIVSEVLAGKKTIFVYIFLNLQPRMDYWPTDSNGQLIPISKFSKEERTRLLELRSGEIRDLQKPVVDFITNSGGTIKSQNKFVNLLTAEVPASIMSELEKRTDVQNIYGKAASSGSLTMH